MNQGFGAASDAPIPSPRLVVEEADSDPATSPSRQPKSDAAEANALDSDSKKDIADCFLRLADLPTSALDRLSRYEHMLWRQARQIVFTLEALRRRKRQPRPLARSMPSALTTLLAAVNFRHPKNP
jgi:hypothetical protein